MFLRRKIPDPGVDPVAYDTSGTRLDDPIVVQTASMDVFLLGDFWRYSVPVGLVARGEIVRWNVATCDLWFIDGKQGIFCEL